MENTIDTVCFNYDPFKSSQVVKTLEQMYDKVERCYSSPWSPYMCFKGDDLFVVNPDGTLFSELPYDAFEIYGKNYFVGKRNSGLLDWSNSPIYNFVVYNYKLKVLYTTTKKPKYLGWRIIACQDEQDNVKIFNPYGEITTDYNIRSVQKFGESGTYWRDIHIDNPTFSVFKITDPSTYGSLYGLINIYGEVVLKPEYDIIEFDNCGNIKASKQQPRTYNGKWESFHFDKFLNTIPAFLSQYKSYYTLCSDLYCVTNIDNRKGVVNNQNVLIIPFEFDSIYGVNNGLAIFRRGDENGVIRLFDSKIIASSTLYDFEICNGLILCRSEHHKYAPYCNINNDEIEWFDKIEHLFNNFFKVKKYDEFGIINSNGEKIIDNAFNRIIISDDLIILIEAYGHSYEGMSGGDYSNDVIASPDIIRPLYGDKISVLSKHFIPLINCDFDIEQFERTNILSYIIKSYRGYGALDSKFNLIIPPIFDSMRFSDCEYISEKGKFTLDGRFIYEDENRLQILNSKFSYCAYLNDNYFVCLNRPNDLRNYKEFKYGILDSNFKEIIPPEYLCIKPTFQNDLFLVQSMDSKWGIISSTHNIVVPIQYDKVAPIKESNSFIVSNNVHNERIYGLYKFDGTLILDCAYKIIGKEFSGFRNIYKDGVWGIVNTSNGVVIYFPNASYIGVVKGQILRINVDGDLEWRNNTPKIRGGKWGYIDILGNFIIPCIYNSAKSVSNNLAPVKKEKWGVVALDSSILVPFEYVNIEILDNVIHCYTGERRYVIFNFDGERIGEDEDPADDYYDEPDDPDPW